MTLQELESLGKVLLIYDPGGDYPFTYCYFKEKTYYDNIEYATVVVQVGIKIAEIIVEPSRLEIA